MKFLFASDSFKGTLSSETIIKLLDEAAGTIFPGCETVGVPIADGGEGTVDAVIAVTHGTYHKVVVHGPLMEERESVYGEFQGDTAVIEMAAASGLPLVLPEWRDPRLTSTYGTGELIKDALDRGYRKIAVAIGGSATNDGGMGAMKALGIRFLDEWGEELAGIGMDLRKVRRIDLSGLHPAVANTQFTVMCDVNNPLTGEHGAAYTFGRQKGGTLQMLKELEAGMVNYAQVVLKETGIDVNQIPGAGAAGGLGAALCVFLKASLKSGIETVLDLIGFDELLNGVDMVITGEGQIDWQSAYGKVPCGVGMRCRKRGIPCIAIAGSMGEGADRIYDHGVDSIMTTINGAMKLDEALLRAEELYADAAGRAFRMIRAGVLAGGGREGFISVQGNQVNMGL